MEEDKGHVLFPSKEGPNQNNEKNTEVGIPSTSRDREGSVLQAKKADARKMSTGPFISQFTDDIHNVFKYNQFLRGMDILDK